MMSESQTPLFQKTVHISPEQRISSSQMILAEREEREQAQLLQPHFSRAVLLLVGAIMLMAGLLLLEQLSFQLHMVAVGFILGGFFMFVLHQLQMNKRMTLLQEELGEEETQEDQLRFYPDRVIVEGQKGIKQEFPRKLFIASQEQQGLFLLKTQASGWVFLPVDQLPADERSWLEAWAGSDTAEAFTPQIPTDVPDES